MHKRIIICGGNGAGKSTFGYALSKETGIPYFDIENYYFPDKTREYTYEDARSKEEVIALLGKDLSLCSDFILAAVKPDYGNDITEMFTHAIYIDVPQEIRIKRVITRSFKKFGDRMMPGGELYEQENDFFSMVKKRSDKYIREWLKKIEIPTFEIDGTKPIKENIVFVTKNMF